MHVPPLFWYVFSKALHFSGLGSKVQIRASRNKGMIKKACWEYVGEGSEEKVKGEF